MVRKEGTVIYCVGGVEGQERRYCYILCGCVGGVEGQERR